MNCQFKEKQIYERNYDKIIWFVDRRVDDKRICVYNKDNWCMRDILLDKDNNEYVIMQDVKNKRLKLKALEIVSW